MNLHYCDLSESTHVFYIFNLVNKNAMHVEKNSAMIKENNWKAMWKECYHDNEWERSNTTLWRCCVQQWEKCCHAMWLIITTLTLGHKVQGHKIHGSYYFGAILVSSTSTLPVNYICEVSFQSQKKCGSLLNKHVYNITHQLSEWLLYPPSNFLCGV